MISEALVKIALYERERHEIMVTTDIYGKSYCMLCDVDLDFHTEYKPHIEQAVLTAVFDSMRAT